ncbi:MAG: zinc dependent phospholipase C family protein [Oscillospiraceae bacterium]
MPECYTHAHTGLQALTRSGHTVASHPAFIAGTNGPDPLTFYQGWKSKRKPDLSVLAKRMHRERTGAFLLALVENAATPVQQSYALGFITHYTTDCTLHPYVVANTAQGAPYAGKNGHRRLEAALDSTLYHRDFKSYQVPLHAGTPVLVTEDLGQVATLLHDTIAMVYDVDVPLVVLADTFHHNLSIRRQLISKTGFKRLLVRLFEPKGKFKGAMSSIVQPAKPLKPLLEKWTNPSTGEGMTLTLNEVLAVAEQTGALCLTAAMRYWLGEMDAMKLAAIFGNNDYYTGLPCGQQQAQPGQAPAPQAQKPR